MANRKTVLTAVGATGASASVSTGTQSSVSAHIYSASTSVATVKIEQSLDGTSWYVVATITNPTSAGELWAGPAAEFTRVNVSAWTSGAITAVMATKLLPSDAQGRQWQKFDAAAGTVGAISTTNVTNGALTAGRVPYSGTAGLQQDSSAFTFDGTTLAAPTLKGGIQATATAMATNGAITVAPGTIWATKAGVLAATLAAPTTTTHDGYRIRVVATTANANTVTTPSNKINGGSAVATFGGAVGDFVEFEAYQGVWYVTGSKNITLS